MSIIIIITIDNDNNNNDNMIPFGHIPTSILDLSPRGLKFLERDLRCVGGPRQSLGLDLLSARLSADRFLL